MNCSECGKSLTKDEITCERCGTENLSMEEMSDKLDQAYDNWEKGKSKKTENLTVVKKSTHKLPRELKTNIVVVILFFVVILATVVIGVNLSNQKQVYNPPIDNPIIPDDPVDPIIPDDPVDPIDPLQCNYSIATDDLYYEWYPPPLLTINDQYLKMGNNYGKVIYKLMVKFNLTDKPENFTKCEISFYVYYATIDYGRETSLRFDLLESEWTEENDTIPVTWKEIGIYRPEAIIGFQRIDITKYLKTYDNIKNASSITIWGSVIGEYKCYIHLYSSEYSGNQSKLPQLIYT